MINHDNHDNHEDLRSIFLLTNLACLLKKRNLNKS